MGRFITSALSQDIDPTSKALPITECVMKNATEVEYGLYSFDLDRLLGQRRLLSQCVLDSEEFNHNLEQQWWMWPTFFDGPAPPWIPSWWLDQGPRTVGISTVVDHFGR